MSLQFFLVVLLFQICVNAVLAEKLIYHSFQSPFDEVDATGDKIVPHWRSSGTTVVNKNFIRLTPDRQSKKGALWSRRGLGVPNFSSILKFRISGQGKTFFGDGLALWITHTAFFNEGEMHGSEEKYFGIGIIFDTFKNTENLAAHRDVTVLVNDGTKTYDMMIEDSNDVIGCNTNIRFHAERGDFSVNDATRAKVLINGSSLIIQMDPRNKGDWIDCVKVDNIGLPADWATSAYIGLTATTGQLADNHDLLSMLTYSDAAVMEMVESQQNTSTLLVVDDLAPTQQSIQKLTEAVNNLIKQIDTLDHHTEHKFVDVYDHIKTIVGKLAHKEEDSEERIALLETLVQKTVGQSVHPRLSSIESQMHGVVDRKFMNMEAALDNKLNIAVEEKASEIKNSVPKGGVSWHLPFFFLLLLVIGAGVAMWLFYQKIRKMHLL